MDDRGQAVNMAFPFQIGPNGTVVTADNERSIRDSVRIILTTRLGERLMENGFGININAYLFEPMNDTTIESIRTEVENTLCEFEPRISDIDTDIQTEDGRLTVNIRYLTTRTKSQGAVSVTYDGVMSYLP